ncbi:MAG TPA: glycerol-3-phosphate 1-O-acyltransferase PlsY [Clostridia bacterium]|nr:MAG: Glycerol-3-phosphate acyltransferase [Firmicutes bacterium ADurb.Bin248]HOG00774.1 glycerol-3-phosphate 1-O-acyltransferase PlsY [Clostridia bacterium]HOS19217.1 glycerol-3-phosphate 1-O-acyltransferase PlsY [Clostridia bacterium]HPK15949.1 glycerol-3-phosphate 1-O-acyltransferase PlsY [Clostridia bacterium]
MQFLLWSAVAAAGYLAGSANFAIIITRWFLHKDVREHGSGNAGTANVARVFGPWIGLLTLAGDVGKTMAAMWFGSALLGTGGMCAAGAACIVGHCFPLYFGFRGGKAVAVTAGVALMLDWRVFLILFALYAATALIIKKVSVASLLAALALPLVMLLLGGFAAAEVLLAAFAALAVWVMHRDNIRRILQGEESRFRFGKRKE